ncbi:MAG: O-antigen ligase family protein [Muribaculaceae bacterium]|nr:O-antigen ligase family protein [Muribaculaceae bacterium]
MRKLNFRLLLIIVFLLLFLLSGIFEGAAGWMQLLGIKPSRHILFPITGTFYNPGPYCAFLGMTIPLALFYILEKKSALLYWVSMVLIIISLPLMPMLLGRTGWIAAAAPCLYIAFRLKWIPTPRGRTLAIWSCAGFAALLFMVYLKPASALGRLLIWRNGLSALISHPLGVGYAKVAGALGEAQEQYFSSHPSTFLDAVAGSPSSAFNEYLQIGIAFGIPAMIIFIAVLLLACYLADRAKNFGVAASTGAFAIICLSSYPLQFPEFVGALAVLIILALLCSDLKAVSIVPVILLTVCCTIPLIFEMNRRNMLSEHWKRHKHAYSYHLSENDEKHLDSLALEMIWNADFYFDYGKSLRGNGRFEKSTEILKKGVEVSSDPMFLNLIGRNYQSIGRYDSAEHYYSRSINRLPGRLYPYYLSARLYSDSLSFDSVKFNAIYLKAMRLTPKVMSPAIKDMKKELQILRDSLKSLE